METFTLVVERAEWMDEAACKGRTNLFFGIAGERPERRVRREASARPLPRLTVGSLVGSWRRFVDEAPKPVDIAAVLV